MARIIIDIGHGGNGHLTNFGASGNGVNEKDFVLDVGKRLRQVLTTDWVCDVALTRDGDYDVSFSDRAAYGKDADRLISLHANGFHDPAAHGFETFVYNGSLKPQTIQYQRTVHRAIFAYLKTHGIRDRGMKQANFAMLRLPPCPCLLVEYLFVTNPREAALAKQNSFRQRLAEQTAAGIAADLNLAKKSKPRPPQEDSIPSIQRTIEVRENGQRTGEVGYLINNQTYIRAGYIGELTGAEVTGHGSYINVQK